MAREAESGSQEFFQIILLTLAMTGTGLLILFLVLNYYMVPNQRQQALASAMSYKKLTELCRSEEMVRLRAQDEAKKAAGKTERSQQAIIEDELERFGLATQRMPLPRDRGGAQEQQVVVEPAALDSILRFVASVKQAKKTMEVAKLQVSRPGRSRNSSQGDVYSATIDFVDYSPLK